jgi:uncharacterized phage-associated protein
MPDRIPLRRNVLYDAPVDSDRLYPQLRSSSAPVSVGHGILTCPQYTEDVRTERQGEVMAQPPYMAKTIAEWFLAWADDEEEAVVSNLKLQKLLYYAQGHYLARNHRPLFAEEIQAWGHGPVVSSVYHDYKAHGSAGIDSDPAFSFDEIDEETTTFLVGVWDTFGAKTAWKLREMTHNEKPWLSTFDEDIRGKVIPTEVIEDYFAGLYAAQARKQK